MSSNLNSWSKILFLTVVIFAVLAVPVISEEADKIQVTDYNNSTSTMDYPAISFVGNDLTVVDANESRNYTMVGPSSNYSKVVARFNETTNTTNTSSLSEGRYYVNYTDIGTDNGSFSRIDLVNPYSDVSGRIRASEGSGPLNSSEMNLTVRHWLNLSEIEVNSTIYGISGMHSTEKIYKLNSSVNKFWIGASAPSQATPFKPSNHEVSKPRINDLRSGTDSNLGYRLRNSSNQSGKILNTTGHPVGGLKVKIKALAIQDKTFADRVPYIYKPPVKTDLTDANGTFNFTGLPPSPYTIEVVNSTHTRTGGSFFRGDIRVGEDEMGESNYTGEYTVSSRVGGMNAEINGQTGKSIRYGVVLFPEKLNATYFVPAENGSNSIGSFPAGNYSAVAFKFNTSTRDIQPESAPKAGVALKSGNTTNISFKFEQKIKYTGYVLNSTSDPVPNATVSARNETIYSSDIARTDRNGRYVLRLKNSTGYRVEVDPPPGSPYPSASTEIKVNGSSNSKNITLPEPASLNGTVWKKSGGKLTDGFVSVHNYSEGTYGSSEINSSGEYGVDGLRKGTNYTVSIYFDGRDETRQISLVNSSQNESFTVDARFNLKLNGTVTKSSDGNLSADVTLLKDGNVVNRTDTRNGIYNFTPSSTGSYQVEVDPDNLSYAEESKYVYIFRENKTVDFNLSQTTTLSGTINNTNGTKLQDVSISASNYTLSSSDWDQSDSDGTYSLELQPGSYEIRLYKQGYLRETAKVKVDSSGSTKNFTMKQGKSLSGQILENGKKSSFSGFIAFWNRSANSFGYSEFSGGNYTVNGLKNKSHNVWISVRNDSYSAEKTSIPFVNSSHSSSNFSLNTNQGKSLKVTVKDSEGTVSNALVTTNSRENKTNSNGVAKFPSQPTDTVVRLSVSKDGYKGLVREINVTEPEPTSLSGGMDRVREVNVTLDRINRLTTDINVSKSGSPVPDASVIFSSSKSGVSTTVSAITGDGGETTMEIPEGSYTVSLALGEDNILTNSTDLKSGGFSTLKMGSSHKLTYNVTE